MPTPLLEESEKLSWSWMTEGVAVAAAAGGGGAPAARHGAASGASHAPLILAWGCCCWGCRSSVGWVCGERHGFPGAAGGAPSPWAAAPSSSSSVGDSGAGMGAFKAENISLSENRQAKATGGTYRDFPHHLFPVTFPTN